MNIFIVGIPRSGKTSFSKEIKRFYPKFNLISLEAIRNGFQSAFPDLKNEFGNRESSYRKVQFPEFIKEFIHWNKIFTKADIKLTQAY